MRTSAFLQAVLASEVFFFFFLNLQRSSTVFLVLVPQEKRYYHIANACDDTLFMISFHGFVNHSPNALNVNFEINNSYRTHFITVYCYNSIV